MDDDWEYFDTALPAIYIASIVISIVVICMCCALCNNTACCAPCRRCCFAIPKGGRAEATVCPSGNFEDFGLGCNRRSCCCTPPGSAYIKNGIKICSFLYSLLCLLMLIMGLLAFNCDGVWVYNSWSNWGTLPSLESMQRHEAHSRGHLHLNRDATRRGHCLSLDAELAWSTAGLTTNQDGNPVPAGWSVERHSSAHAMFGLHQWIPGYSEAVQTTLPEDGCSPLTTTFPNGGVALIARGTCTFVEKAAHAQQAGAEAVVMYDLPAAVGHGEADCKSVHHYTGSTGKTKHGAWCYTETGACADGKASDRFEAVDWSMEACAAPKDGCTCTLLTKDDFETNYGSSWWSFWGYGYYGYGDDDDGEDDVADDGPNEHHGNYWWSDEDDANYNGRDDDGANREPTIDAMGCSDDDDVTRYDASDGSLSVTTTDPGSGDNEGGAARTYPSCDSIKIPVLMLAHNPAQRLLETLKVAPYTTIDLMCDQVKHDHSATGTNSEDANKNTLGKDEASELANGEALSENNTDIWQLRNISIDDDYFSFSSRYYYDDDDWDSEPMGIAQVGNAVCNSINMLVTLAVLWNLMPCRDDGSVTTMRFTIGLSSISLILFLIVTILTWLDWESCYANFWLYPLFTFWVVPIIIFLESKLLRAAAAAAAAAPKQEGGFTNSQAAIAMENPVYGIDQTEMDQNNGYMDVSGIGAVV